MADYVTGRRPPDRRRSVPMLPTLSCPATCSPYLANAITIRRPGLLLRIPENDFARLLGDHVDRRDDEEPRNFGEDRGIHHAQVFRAVDLEIAVEHAIFIRRTDGASASGVMAPSVFFDEPAQFLPALDVLAGQLLLLNVSTQALCHCPHELDPFHHRLQVFLVSIVTFVEVAKVDPWHLARIGRS